MADFNIRTDAVDVEQIMRQIRARIQDKRGVDYTEEQIQELASVKLERFLDPKGVRSDLVEQFRRSRERTSDPFHPHQFRVDANDLYGSSRGPIRLIRKLFNPILKLMVNSNRLVQVLHEQSEINVLYEKQIQQLRDRRDALDALYYELVHNLVLELTRIGIENRNLKMRVESLSSRLDFDERRARSLEGVVQYRPGSGPSREPAPPPRTSSTEPPPMRPGAQSDAAVPPNAGEQTGESTTARRRRRRRRGRRGGRGRPDEAALTGTELSAEEPLDEVPPAEAATPPHGDPTGTAALDAHDSHDTAVPAGDDQTPDPSQQ